MSQLSQRDSSLVADGASAPDLRFRPPLCAQLREWVKGAQPNARLTYGEGSVLAEACNQELRELVMRLADKGFLTPHYKCAAPGRKAHHFVQRTHRRFHPGMAL